MHEARSRGSYIWQAAGNINQLVIKADSYAQQLERTGGLIAEFVNPKYADSSRSKFKSPTRLECMMQDYAKELPSEARTGFTVIKEVSTSVMKA